MGQKLRRYPSVARVARAVRKYPGYFMTLSVYDPHDWRHVDWSLDLSFFPAPEAGFLLRAPAEMTVAQSLTFARKLVALARKQDRLKKKKEEK